MEVGPNLADLIGGCLIAVCGSVVLIVWIVLEYRERAKKAVATRRA